MNIKEIELQEESIENVHESIFKSYQTLIKVKQMIDRKDSIQTIKEFIEHLYQKRLDLPNNF